MYHPENEGGYYHHLRMEFFEAERLADKKEDRELFFPLNEAILGNEVIPNSPYTISDIRDEYVACGSFGHFWHYRMKMSIEVFNLIASMPRNEREPFAQEKIEKALGIWVEPVPVPELATTEEGMLSDVKNDGYEALEFYTKKIFQQKGEEAALAFRIKALEVLKNEN